MVKDVARLGIQGMRASDVRGLQEARGHLLHEVGREGEGRGEREAGCQREPQKPF